ncbi:SpaA isopeptide-forming pilin-related protein [Blautia massiliensis (ex Liu et al. 2021)]|uniref:SpaA isopeptide-forming pilin-related protein n=1 Tax=Blautia massiliensis (ex Liu et al. 2021) TaxID=3062492 RepID=UPI003F8A9E18
MKADCVNENSSVSYDTVSQKLSAAATDKGSSLRGFFAYDVYFADGDGNRVEPNGRVRVTFEYKTPAAPELTDAASTSVTAEKLHYNSSTGDTDVNTLQANEDLKVLNVNEGKQIQTLQVETGNAAVFAVMWDSPETADVEAEAVSGNEDEVSIASEELTDGMYISDEPEQDAAETPAAENPEVTPEAEPSEAPAENPDAEPTEAPAEDPDVVEEPAEDIASPEDVPAADENGETSLIEVLGDDTNLRVSPSIEAEVLATVNAGTQLTLLDTVTAEDGATWYKVSWEGTEAYIRSDMAQVVESSDEAEEVEDVLESEEVSYSKTIGDVVVTATAASGVLPEDAQFVVNPIEKGSDQYTDVADRLEKKAENEDYSIAGFLAYDIYFQDSEGNKINPEEGKVKVSMEYQNATAPDEVKEADAATMAMASADENSQDDTETAEQNLSVSVMHFVEDENGNVESVVDMTKDDTANVETNAEGEVQKAEFETESFSTFTITWKYYYAELELELEVELVDTNGIGIDKTVADISISNWDFSGVNVSNIAPEVEGYVFDSAKLGAYNSNTKIQRFRVNRRYIQYSSDSSGNNWKNVGNNEVYFVYEKQGSLTYVNTIDSKSKGINMKMIDYNGQQFGGYEWADDKREVKQGILSSTLGADGYPTFITEDSTKNRSSLKDQSLKQFYNGATDVNHLFLEDVYNSDGKYFYYNSEENGASLNSANESGVRDFSVFKELTTPKNESAPIYQRGNFLPYDTFLKKTKSKNTNLYDSSGNPIPPSSKRRGEPLYLPDNGNDKANYYFGMEMDAKFIQGKNGYYDGNPMKYEFTGDDDLWVYIDGVLVLDMGGCHDARSGYIDFSNGKVVVENQVSDNKETTLQECFRAAEKYNEADWKDNGTFKDYTSHTIKMFYMERGAGASNLKIKFNLPTVPKGQVKVTKELSNTDKEKYANVDFYFQMYAQKKQKDGTYSNDEYELLGSKNSNAKKEGSGEKLTFTDGITFEGDNKTYNNVFCLKAGETALFNDLDANRKYYVQEIGVKSSEYDKVTINTTEKTTEDGTAIESEKASVDERQMITFINNCTVANSRELKITKKVNLVNSDKKTEDRFSFKVKLSDQNGALVPYEGEYYLLDKDENYWYYDDDGILTSNGNAAKVCGTTTDGVISGVKDGWSIVITGILSGTEFKVTEQQSDTEKGKYKEPTYETAYIADKGHEGKETTSKNTGKIELYQDAQVTVTNTPYAKIKVTKEWKDGNGNTLSDIDVGINVGLYKLNTSTNVYEPVSEGSLLALNRGENYTATFSKLDPGYEYKVKELRTVKSGELAEFIINNTGYIQTSGSTDINGSNYKVTYSDFTLDETDETQKNITITNTKSDKIKVVKEWTDRTGNHDGDSVIVGLYKGAEYTKKQITLNKDNSWTGEFWVDNVAAYSVKEMKEESDALGKKTYSPIEAGSVIKVGDNDYKVSYSEETSTSIKKVTVTNTRLGTISITKVDGKTESKKLEGAEFKLQKKKGDNYVDVSDETVTPATVKTVTTGTDGKAVFDQLEPGTYKIIEIKAPTGYMLSTEEITVEIGSGENKEFTIEKAIKNYELYELPNSGGPGTYGFTISGVAILATALLLFINNKRREEEAKRS